MKVNENGTLLKVKYLILLNIFSVFHTPVGMFLQSFVVILTSLSSPRMWGCSPLRLFLMICVLIFPLMWGCSRKSYRDFIGKYSPRMWGCSCPLELPDPRDLVFPTHVGMFLGVHHSQRRLPHACGDVPHGHDDESAQIVFPTHVGMFLDSTVFLTHVGMFLRVLSLVMYIPVFPTLVGMFLFL